jgi:crossover junction endodeoxyribonuclease RuvC
VAKARGVALLALAQSGLIITEYAPNEVKLAATCYGPARTEQVEAMVCYVLHPSLILPPDDASEPPLLAFVTHMLRSNTLKALK